MTTDELRAVLTEAIRKRSEVALTTRDDEIVFCRPLRVDAAYVVVVERGQPDRYWVRLDLGRVARVALIASWSAR